MEDTQSSENFFLIVGLGNPGSDFSKTAHNIGRDFLLFLAENQKTKFSKDTKNQALILKTEFGQKKIILLLPETYMNRSGISVLQTMKYFKISLRRLLVIQDDSDMTMGQMKLVTDQSSAGHRGIESIITSLKGKDFSRLKVGIRPGSLVANSQKGYVRADRFVLKRISDRETVKIFPEMEKAVSLWLEKGISLAMNEINRKN